MKKPCAVLGLGNPLMGDEGIGIVLVQRMNHWIDVYPEIDFIDAGTGGVNLIHLLDGRRQAIFIDCAFMEEGPGAIKYFTLDEIESVKTLSCFSLHEGDLISLLRMAGQLGSLPQRLLFWGIQPESVQPRRGLSKTLRVRLDEYMHKIKESLDNIKY